MAHSKDRHYWAQLRIALTAGVWSSSSPARTPKGYSLSWSELVRKFNKHCVGFKEVAEIASQIQALNIWLSENTLDEDQLGSEPDGQLCLASECILLPERAQEATEGYQALKKLQSTRSDSLLFALAYYAYAFGEPTQCLDYLSKVPAIPDAQSHIPSSSTLRSDTSVLHPTSSTTDVSTSWTGSFLSAEPPPYTANIVDGRAWAMSESIRSICLQGMCLERLHPDNPGLAIQAYTTVIPLLKIIEFETPRSQTSQTLHSSFSQYRELWRWVERLMFRAITLLARTQHLDDHPGLIWNLFTHYDSCSSHWPPSFRTSHRSIIAVLHLRALVIQFRAHSSQTLSPFSRSEKPLQWLGTARSIIDEYRAILAQSTHFPKAGERNVKVEDLVDLSVAVWEASGAMADQAQWVIDVLWWATRLTFNSYRVFRHMSRLSYITGDTEVAKRSLRLYTEVLSKTRAAGIDGDCDCDRHWVEALVEGARMFCRLALSRFGSGGVEEAKEAGEFLEKAKTRLCLTDKQLVARVALAEGIWNTTTATIERLDHTRPTKLHNALEHYLRSVETFPTPSAHHQLALALALPGPSQNLDGAIASARTAVEGAPNEIRHWHLLGLLLTARGEWTKAREVLEIGAAINESPTEMDESPSDTEVAPERSEKSEASEGVSVADSETEKVAVEVLSRDGNDGTANGTIVHAMILDPNATAVPSSATLLQTLPDHPIPTPQDAFEYALQLRLTQMAVTEHVEGPEGAETKWVDVFGWIAERKRTISETQLRSSVDTSSRSAVTQPGSAVIVSEIREMVCVEVKTDLTGSVEPLSVHPTTRSKPPPITVTPATPAEAERKFPLSPLSKHSFSVDASAGKKMQQMLKSRVHKGQEKISTISRKIGHGVVRNGTLRRSDSAPDFHEVFQNQHYQASSIHSRRPLRSLRRSSNHGDAEQAVDDQPVPPPTPTPTPQDAKPIPRASREDKLLSELWASSAATFRRLGKIDQAKGAIQEAEVKNQENPSVWVQLGLYYYALNHDRQAVEAFQKALFVSPDDVSAVVHMCRVYLTPRPPSLSSEASPEPEPDKVDLSAGLLGYMSRGPGWDVPEVWYFLAKAYGLRGQKDKQRECLTTALSLSENRCIRDLGHAVGWCL